MVKFLDNKSTPVYILCAAALAFVLVGCIGGTWFQVWRGAVCGLFFAIPALALAIYKARKNPT